MAKRNIVKIDEEKCTGCGLCISSCAEGAIQMVDGVARLVSDTYCDGLGACLGECPVDAITIEERDAPEFDEEAAKEHVAKMNQAENQNEKQPEKLACGCPGTQMRTIARQESACGCESVAEESAPSALINWPVQLKLAPAMAPFFQNADLLLAADCVPFALADFHARYLNGKPLVIGCPKLDDAQYYVDKLADILKMGQVKSLTVTRMEVPCCSGLVRIAQMAMEKSGSQIPFTEVVVGVNGSIVDTIDRTAVGVGG